MLKLGPSGYRAVENTLMCVAYPGRHVGRAATRSPPSFEALPVFQTFHQ